MSAVDAEPAVLAPLPIPSIETQPFWAAVQERKLLMPKCDRCGKVTFPPTVACPHCGNEKSTWTAMSGRGKVFSFVVYHRVYHPSLKEKVPYVVALIELEEGPRIISTVVGMPIEEVTCELPVQVLYEEVRDGYLIPKFQRR